MRTRKPAASARGATCHRCTALLQGAVDRCTMCGWPAGVGYPPAEGEVEAAAVDVTPEATVDADAEHSAAQLDALAGMAQRQEQPIRAETPTQAETGTPTAPPTEAPELAAASEAADEPVDESADVDPLTAPLDALPEPIAADPSLEATPLHDTVVTETTEATADGPSSSLDAVTTSTTVPTTPWTPATDGPQAGRAASLARPTQLLIVAAAVLNLVLAGLQAAFGTPVDASMTTVVLGVALLTLAVWTGAAVCFLHWVSRAYAHVAAYSRYQQRHGATMALVGWLIPIVGFVIGYRVLQDLYTGSSPETRQDANAKPSGGRMVDVWLLGLVVATVFAYALPAALGESGLWSGLAALGVVTAGLALAATVSRVSEWQSEPWTVTETSASVATEAETVNAPADEVEASEPVEAVTTV
ncbi:MAG TPA: DUF4328 domain-containing protein [Actinomycetes bacterium]|nr:DUF4328 domain-containing protein [Actinomycetes bacterium]